MPRSARKEGYSRLHRFSERGSFGPVLRSPRKIRGRFAVIHALPGAGQASRLGLALTRRLVASSVHRNLVKRMAREAFRRHAVKLSGIDCVVTLREKFDPVLLDPMAEEFAGLLDRLFRGDSR